MFSRVFEMGKKKLDFRAEASDIGHISGRRPWYGVSSDSAVSKLGGIICLILLRLGSNFVM